MLYREALLGASRIDRVKHAVETAPLSRSVVARYVAGPTAAEAVAVSSELVEQGMRVSVDFLGEDTTETALAQGNTQEYVALLDAISRAGLSPSAEVSVKPSAIGLGLAEGGEAVALANGRRICQAARNAGSMVTLDMEEHRLTEATLRLLGELRLDFPSTGAVLQACLHRSERDARELATEGSRVRLCKGAYLEPASIAYASRDDVDRAYVRCLRILMASTAYPMVATHDPRLIAIAGALAKRYDRDPGGYEYQMLHGVRPDEQRRLATSGETMRVYLPYGAQWYGYMTRRMAERPANLGLFLRSLVSRG